MSNDNQPTTLRRSPHLEPIGEMVFSCCMDPECPCTDVQVFITNPAGELTAFAIIAPESALQAATQMAFAAEQALLKQKAAASAAGEVVNN